MTYDQFCDGTGVEGVEGWMELLRPDNGTEVLRGYRHWAYAPYAAATLHPFGRGQAAYLGAKLEAAALEALLETLLPRLGVLVGSVRWPLVVKSGVNGQGAAAHVSAQLRPRHILYGGAPLPGAAC